MSAIVAAPEPLPEQSPLAALLEHLGRIPDPRDVRRILHPLHEILLLVVCGTIADCDDYDAIAGWGETHADFLRRHLPYANWGPGGRPGLLSTRATEPPRPPPERMAPAASAPV